MAYLYPDVSILVFCKAPILNQVKTRLIPELTAQQAVNAHIQLTNSTLAKLSESGLAPIELWCSPDCKHSYFQQCADKYGLKLYQQSGNDLGLKMYHAIHSGLQRADNVVLIGTDCPSLKAHDVTQSLDRLIKGTDIVLGPAEDGGYVLIGMSRPHHHLFQDIEWGGGLVLAQTKRKIEQSGLTLFETVMQWDVDTPRDWQRYQQLVQSLA